MDEEILLCKDCKHSRMDMVDKIFTLGGRVGVADSNYKCAKFPKKTTVVENMVTGPEKSKAKLHYCELARWPERCGRDAKYWSPKHKKDLFKMLKKESYD